MDLLKFDIREDNLPVRREQIRARHALYPTMILAMLALEPVLAWLMWAQVNHVALLLWLLMLFAAHAWELWQWTVHPVEELELADCRLWNLRFKWHTGTVATLWGVGWWLMFVPDDFAMQLILMCTAMGLTAGAVTGNATHRPSLHLFVLLVLGPLIVRMALEADQQHLALAAMLVLYGVYLLKSGARLMNTFELSLVQRFDKETLLKALHAREEETVHALESAEQANRAKSKFLATASHDLRQPLQALRLFTEALQEEAKTPAVSRLAGQIDSAVTALVDMFEDLLDVSRMDAGVVRLQQQHFSLYPLFDRLHADYLPVAREKGLELVLPARSAGGQQQELTVYSDPMLLERLMRNLITNALRYTERGKVTVNCRNIDGNIWIAVQDTGVGISAKDLPRIFEEYYQVSNPNRDRRKGLGLGLAIVTKLSRILGCRVTVKSEVGVGSTFEFAIPCGVPQAEIESAAPGGLGYDLSDVKAVLVEDDADIREQVGKLMKQWGCQVFAGETADEVMYRLEALELKPDFIVCDYRLSQGVTALDVIQRLRDYTGVATPALVLTGDTGAEVLHRIHASGAQLLHKPVTPERLRSVMYLMLHSQH